MQKPADKNRKRNFKSALLLPLIIGFLLLLADSCSEEKSPKVQTEPPFEIKGADISFLPDIKKSGLLFYNAAGTQEDMLHTLKNAGINTVRIRLWNNASNSISGIDAVKKLAQECRSLGFKIWLCVHYSETWADPAKQTKPTAWKDLSFPQLLDSVSVFTRNFMDDIAPDYVQIGNEINNGILWPEGHFNNLEQMKAILSKCTAAVRSANTNTQIILHYAGYEQSHAFFSQMNALDYDMVGLSYYPIWHGKDLNALVSCMQQLGEQTKKPIVIAETSYPFTLGWNDYTNNVIGLEDQLLPAYPATPIGQKNFLLHLQLLAQGIDKYAGICYWGGEWVSYKGPQSKEGSAWENQAFWDFNNKALPVLEAFK